MSVKPNEIELSIVMPCLNEVQTLGTCIEKAQKYLRNNKVCGEVVIGDNGSTDGSQVLAEKLGARVIAVPTKGYGAALHAAVLASHGKFIIMGDSDDSYDFLNLEAFVQKLREGFDLVMGNRFLGGIKPGAMPWKNRYIGNPVLTAIGKVLFSAHCSDFHCGLRGFSKDAFLKMKLSTTGMEFASEMVIKATLSKMKVTEVPTTLSPDGRDRPPHLRPWRDGWRHLRFMLLMSPRWTFIIPGFLLWLAGTALGILLLQGPLQLGAIRLDVNTLVFCLCASLLGSQTLSVGLLAKIFAESHGVMEPKESSLSRLLKYFSLEKGLVFSGLLFVLGFLGGIESFLTWRQQSYGDLNVQNSLRAVVPSVFFMLMGLQLFVFSFFSDLLKMGTRK